MAGEIRKGVNWGRVGVIAVPYLWLTLFFLFSAVYRPQAFLLGYG